MNINVFLFWKKRGLAHSCILNKITKDIVSSILVRDLKTRKATWGPPGGHQKRRPIRKNIWFRDIKYWWPPLLRLLNINSNESGGHHLLISRNHIFFRMGRPFWWPPGGPQVLLNRAPLWGSEDSALFSKCKNVSSVTDIDGCPYQNITVSLLRTNCAPRPRAV